jgi:hypothetical protein
VLYECPKSYISADAETTVEEFLVRRRLGGLRFSELTARQAEAFVLLEKALVEEINRGQQSRRSTSEQLS